MGNDKLYGYTALITAGAVGLTSIQVVGFNSWRTGAIIYNNSANSVYMAYGSMVSSATFMTAIIPTFTQWVMPSPIFIGPLSFVRNAGSGSVMITEIIIQRGNVY